MLDLGQPLGSGIYRYPGVVNFRWFRRALLLVCDLR